MTNDPNKLNQGKGAQPPEHKDIPGNQQKITNDPAREQATNEKARKENSE